MLGDGECRRRQVVRRSRRRCRRRAAHPAPGRPWPARACARADLREGPRRWRARRAGPGPWPFGPPPARSRLGHHARPAPEHPQHGCPPGPQQAAQVRPVRRVAHPQLEGGGGVGQAAKGQKRPAHVQGGPGALLPEGSRSIASVSRPRASGEPLMASARPSSSRTCARSSREQGSWRARSSNSTARAASPCARARAAVRRSTVITQSPPPRLAWSRCPPRPRGARPPPRAPGRPAGAPRRARPAGSEERTAAWMAGCTKVRPSCRRARPPRPACPPSARRLGPVEPGERRRVTRLASGTRAPPRPRAGPPPREPGRGRAASRSRPPAPGRVACTAGAAVSVGSTPLAARSRDKLADQPWTASAGLVHRGAEHVVGIGEERGAQPGGGGLGAERLEAAPECRGPAQKLAQRIGIHAVRPPIRRHHQGDGQARDPARQVEQEAQGGGVGRSRRRPRRARAVRRPARFTARR